MNSLFNTLPGQKTYLASAGMILTGIFALVAPDAMPDVNAAEMIGTGAVAMFVRMGIAKDGAKK